MRKDIQALRALAVMAVFIYHMRPSVLTGGFIGVDVFFVLSGFLISSHLFDEFAKTGKLSLSQFWSRRAKRLLPASFTVLTVTAFAVWFIAPQALQERYFRDITAASVYAVNWVFAVDSVDYLAAENSASVVQHFWSLGVEEQLYIAWPVLLTFAWILGRRHIGGFKVFGVLLALITIASLAHSAILVIDNNPTAYFSTLSRAWEFGAGALLALCMRASWFLKVFRHTFRLAMSWAGWLTLGAYLYFFKGETGFPGLFAIIPVVATLLIIGANDPSGHFSPASMLRLKPIQFIGDASYSIYLWHWPLLTFVGFYYSNIPGRVLVIIFVATLLISYLSMRFIENPFRFGPLRLSLSPRKTLVAVGATMGILVMSSQIASATVVSEIEARRVLSANLERELADQVAKRDALSGSSSIEPNWDEISCMGPAFLVEPECGGFSWETVVPAVAVKEETAHNVEPLERIGSQKGCLAWGDDYSMIECVYGVEGGQKVALIGDSHAYHWLPAMAAVAKSNNLELHFVARAGCPANELPREATGDHVRGCYSWINEMTAWAGKNSDLATIIIANFSGSRFAGAGEYGARHDAAVEGYKEAWKPLLATGAELIIFKDTPFIGEDAWSCVVNNSEQMSNCDVTLSSMEANYDNSAAAALELGLKVIDFTSYFCKDEMCPMAVGGVRVYRDSNHMSGTYNLLLAPYLRKELFG